ncbi:hypothetical protein GCM10007940_28200 [Portibacter lacus]|uniref:Uncharacterized protein n=2 Tax=Portibacter lacus TaxID=1099794 RepID=A0AA37SQV7_9BACT|nr:hypothetical protein GCM10007940_28200 [Portibacter lacus]
MEVISKNKVAKETLSFKSPIDSLQNDGIVIRTYGKDGREQSNTQYVDGQASVTHTYQYSSLYSKVRVCTSIPSNLIENCYDLVWSEDDNKLYKTLDNGFTPTTYAVMKPPFDLDKQRKPLVAYHVAKYDTTFHDNKDSLDSSLEVKKKTNSSMYFKYEYSYKESMRNGKHILQSESKTWINGKRKRNKTKENNLKIEFDPSIHTMSFFVSQGKKDWALNQIQSYNEKGLFTGKEIFVQKQGYRLSEKLFLKQGDHYKMEVQRGESGLVIELKEFVNDQLFFITNYEYEYYD